MPRSSTAFTTYQRLASFGFICLLCVLLILGLQPYIPLEYLTGDPAALSGQPFYFGALSNIGVLFWIASAAICLFSAALLSTLKARSESIRFLSAFGSLSTVLGLDDLFLLHERAFPFLLRVSQSSVLLGYAIILLICLCRFRKILLNHRPAAFGVSLILFSVSVLSDIVPLDPILGATTNNNIFHLLEDGTKLIAIFVWLTYFAWTAIILVTEATDKIKIDKITVISADRQKAISAVATGTAHLRDKQ